MKNITWQNFHITKQQRAKLKNQKPVIIWFTGLSGSGKSTIANALEVELFKIKKHTFLLDGDNIRYGLNKDLGFSKEDRQENIRRVAEVSKLFLDAGLIVITSFISPYKEDRDFARNLVQKDEFIEVFIDTPLEVCEKRDSKGLYKKAKEGTIKEFTGISSSYEKPINPEIHIKTEELGIEKSVQVILDYLKNNNYI